MEVSAAGNDTTGAGNGGVCRWGADCHGAKERGGSEGGHGRYWAACSCTVI